MDRERIRTMNDLVVAVCQAIQNQDEEALEEADRASMDWMVDTDTKCAINTLLDTADEVIALLDSIEELEELEDWIL